MFRAFVLFMEKALVFVIRFTAYVYAQSFEKLFILIADDYGKVSFTALEVVKLVHSELGDRIGQSRNCKGNEHLVCVEAGVFVLEVVGFKLTDRFKDLSRNQVEAVVN